MARTDARTKPIETAPLAERVYHLLRVRIANGDYPADHRLPSENSLAQQFEVSRPIIRDALQRLREEGLIHSRQGAGSFVQAKHDNRVLGFAPVETIADIQRCYEFRIAIEPAAARFAATRRSSEAIESLSGLLEVLRDDTRQHRHRQEADFAFHVAISEASNNHFYSASMHALRDHIAVGMRLHGLTLMAHSKHLENVFDEHKSIFDAIRDRSSTGAHDAMLKHLEGSRDRLFEGRLLDLANPGASKGE